MRNGSANWVQTGQETQVDVMKMILHVMDGKDQEDTGNKVPSACFPMQLRQTAMTPCINARVPYAPYGAVGA